MNRFRIWKTEFTLFNVLHALGLAIVLTECANEEVQLCDSGASFVLTMEGEIESWPLGCTVRDILLIPSANEIARASKLALGNLDGLLAATLTMPGPRVSSVADLKSKTVQRQGIAAQALEKVESLISRVCRSVHSQLQPTANWISSIAEDYRDESAVVPQFQARNGNSLTLTMPLDPAFGFSSRRPCSDAMINQKAALCMPSPRFGAALAYVGAARYLRAQRTKGSGILLYVPEFTDFVVKPHSVCNRLPASHVPAQQAMYVHWLSTWRTYHKSASGVLIQTMQTQGAKQSVSTCRTRLSYSPLDCLGQHGCNGIVRYWRQVLGGSREEADTESDLLIDLLSTFDHAAIRAYLTDMARRSFGKSEPSYVHTIEELKAMITCNPGNDSVMAQIVERTKGTLRFAQAIRLLGEHNRSAAKEIIDDLDVVQTQDKLLRVLARSVQQCVLAKAKNDFIIVPDEDDVGILLEDVDRFGVRDVSGLVIILSAVGYPRKPKTPESTDNVVTENQSAIAGTEGDDR